MRRPSDTAAFWTLPIAGSLALLLSLLIALTGCGSGATADQPGPPQSSSVPAGDSSSPVGAPSASPTVAAPVADPEHSVAPPGPLTGPQTRADLLVYARDPIAAETVRDLEALDGVAALEQISLAQVAVQDEILQIAAVQPASYRLFNPARTATEDQVWSRVAGGELAIDQKLGEKLQDASGVVRLGNDQDAAALHIGAYAPQVPQIDAVVNPTWIETLGMETGNALVINTGKASPQSVRPRIQELVGKVASVQVLGPDLDTTVSQTAFLTGGSVATAVGSFGYRVIGGGRIAPDPAWVKANIRTQTVPILGSVTCHKLIFPQLRAALTEIRARGLADEINVEEYAGCYYPRFIAGSTKLSLHSFGIALDLNVPGNQRGTVGEMNRDVVAIFARWGFAWGGDWNYTDPMHFEMDRLVDPR
ncbi:MAG: M15 family metallopeptidase [Nocardioides sp.]